MLVIVPGRESENGEHVHKCARQFSKCFIQVTGRWAQTADGAGTVCRNSVGPDEGSDTDCAAPIKDKPVTTGELAMRDLPWRDFLHGEHRNEIRCWAVPGPLKN